MNLLCSFSFNGSLSDGLHPSAPTADLLGGARSLMCCQPGVVLSPPAGFTQLLEQRELLLVFGAVVQLRSLLARSSVFPWGTHPTPVVYVGSFADVKKKSLRAPPL